MDNRDFAEIEVTLEEAARIVVKHYGIAGVLRRLPGEVDFNFYLKSEEGQEYTVKISRPNTDVSFIEFQSDIINYLSASGFPLNIPKIIPSVEQKEFILLDDNRYLRLQEWVPGRMLSDVIPRSQKVLTQWGRTCGMLSKYLKGFNHNEAHRFYKWNPSNTLDSRKYREYIKDEEELKIVDYFWDLFENEALHLLKDLRKSVNYNDAHEHNILADHNYKNPTITGIIDFGDVLYSETINELAIGCAYGAMYLPDPLQGAAVMVQAYNEVNPLEDKELRVLFSLIAGRLLITVSSAALNKYKEPENEYLLISEKAAWDLLKKWRTIPPSFGYYTFRHACGLEPCPSAPKFREWVRKRNNEFGKVVDIKGLHVKELDLSVGSLELGNNSNFEDIGRFQKRIIRSLEDDNSSFGIGGYGETRPFYTTDSYTTKGNGGARWRTVHLGIDIWGKAGTSVFAPIDGRVFSLQNNIGDCDYGPTVILEHIVNEKLTFYTLYGHLDMDTLKQLEVGKLVPRGQKIATIGSPPVNGNWPPHLHFQVMLDMLGNDGDFPGVAFPEERDIWLSICPNGHPFTYPADITIHESGYEISIDNILTSRKEILGKSLSISYNIPLHIVRGYMQYLYSDSGRRFLDTVNNVAHVGHEHPRVVKAAQQQMAVLNTNTRYLHENILLFAEEILQTFPSELSVVHFVNSGSEANELALRMVKAITGQNDMIAVKVGYHGNTGGCIGVSSYKFDGKGGQGAPMHTHVVPIPDTYRGDFRDPLTAGKLYSDFVKKAVKDIQNQDRNVGGFICESILSCGGQVVLPDNYLKESYRHVRLAGGICIADEVQVGFGRVGKAFWGFELQDVIPDIVTLGKPIGNGHPLAAVVTTHEIAEAFANGMEYFNTFGGNPVSCAIGREVLQIIKDEKLQENAHEVGEYLKTRLKNLQSDHPIIGDVRGYGLFLGFELVKSRDSRDPASEEAEYLANRMRDLGILMSTDGPHNNVLKIKPPMCFDISNADSLIEHLDMVLKEDFLRASMD